MNKFITFEGVDGAGKSTHLAWFADALRQRGCDVVVTREPGGTPLGEQLREILLHQPMSIGTEALLMFAARLEHIEQVIKPALSAGKWVISDRFMDSTRAYQGTGATKKIIELVTMGRLHHGGHPVLRWMAGCAATQDDRRDNIMFDKPDRAKSANRIDGLSAMACAFSRLISVEPETQSYTGVRSV